MFVTLVIGNLIGTMAQGVLVRWNTKPFKKNVELINCFALSLAPRNLNIANKPI